jgi:hypothetical protein
VAAAKRQHLDLVRDAWRHADQRDRADAVPAGVQREDMGRQRVLDGNGNPIT